MPKVQNKLMSELSTRNILRVKFKLTKKRRGNKRFKIFSFSSIPFNTATATVTVTDTATGMGQA